MGSLRGAVAALVFVLVSLGAGTREPGVDWPVRGVNVTAYTAGGYASPEAADALRRARALGATHVSLVPSWYQPSQTVGVPAVDPDRTPGDASLIRAAAVARSLGLKVILKPHVDLLDGEFRGEISPLDRDAWFDAYTRMIEGYARLARRIQAETLVVGTELTSLTTPADERRWRAIIGRARSLYGGSLTYAANWVEAAEEIRFWDALDVIGIDAYMPLTRAPSRDVAALEAAWGRWVARAEALHERTGRPVLLTELGYQNRADASVLPYDATGARDDTVQARLYEAAFRAWSGRGWFRGIVWWDWSAEGRDGDPANRDFSPRGKPAEQVLRAWLR